jgi:hypothetical protein
MQKTGVAIHDPAKFSSEIPYSNSGRATSNQVQRRHC